VKQAVRCQPILLVLLGATLLLVGIAWLRSAEYDEQYTLFLTGRAARPVWSADLHHRGRNTSHAGSRDWPVGHRA
jgi:hypothetical protein